MSLRALYYLVEVAYSAGLDGAGKRAVYPDSLVAFEQVSAHKVAGSQVFVTCDGHKRQVVPCRPYRRCR